MVLHRGATVRERAFVASSFKRARDQTAPLWSRLVRFDASIVAPALEPRRMRPAPLFDLLKQTISKFMRDDALTLAAAMAFYTLLSLAPLLVLAVAVAGLAWG